MHSSFPGKPLLGTTVVVLGMLAVGVGCGDRIQRGGQHAGQRCVKGSDCVPGLVCHQRRCVPGSYRRADGGVRDTAVDAGVDTEPTIDTGVGCEVGTRTCAGDSSVRICRASGPVVERCRSDATPMVCRGGRCVPDRPCQDSDGDGHGENCGSGPDCDDSNPSVHSDAPERCETPIDDNCDGKVNESCTECCSPGCRQGQFCNSCSCTAYDSQTCKHPFQPCDRRGRDGDFFCTDLGDLVDDLRCLDACDKSLENPASDCKTPNSACLFGDENQGICFNGCTLEQGCGLDGFGCLPYEGPREGICIPTNPNNSIGDPCDADETLDCEAGALCIGQGGGRGRCVEACRPFSEPNATDCTGSERCLPISKDVGICVADNGKSIGESCQNDRTACGADSVICLAAGGGTRACQRVCRVTEGDADCDGSETCRDVDPNSGDNDLGICR